MISLPPINSSTLKTNPNKSLLSWAENKIEYEKRPRIRWKQEFEQKIVSAHNNRIKGPSWEERRMKRMLASGWTNVTNIKLPSKQTKLPSLDLVEDTEDSKSEVVKRGRGNYCFRCWDIVEIGPHLVQCNKCNTVIHLACMMSENDNEDDEHIINDNNNQSSPFNPNSSILSAKTSKFNDSSFNSTTSASILKPPPWTCSECIEDEISRKEYWILRHRLQYRQIMEVYSIVKVQSFARMVVYRLDFLIAKIGITYLQNAYRSRKAWLALKNFEEKRFRSFR